jgi:hypothetical protein
MRIAQTSEQDREAQVIKAPSLEPFKYGHTVFLAGSALKQWRPELIKLMESFPITILDPARPDWDSTWIPSIDFPPFREQVQWELEMQERADMIVVYLAAGTDAPISMFELGLSARSGKVVVVCEDGYSRKGNVDIVCDRYGIEMVDDGLIGLAKEVKRRLLGE